MPTPSELSPREVIKRQLLLMIAAIVILDSIAIPVFYLMHFNLQVGPRQNTYIGAWMLLSALVVAVQLRKIRRARRELMAGGMTTGGGGQGAGGGNKH
jgi:hypothetical protein